MSIKKLLYRLFCTGTRFSLFQAVIWCFSTFNGLFFYKQLRSSEAADSEPVIFAFAFFIMALLTLLSPRPKTQCILFSLGVTALMMGFALYGIVLLGIRTKVFLAMLAAELLFAAIAMLLLIFLRPKKKKDAQ
ncbi:MAG: hypothetical protein IKB34_04530 [Clostridia bacterium]|nr:hypothetical protein [Clostridia bacterium]